MEPMSPSGAARVCRRRAGRKGSLKRPRSLHTAEVGGSIPVAPVGSNSPPGIARSCPPTGWPNPVLSTQPARTLTSEHQYVRPSRASICAERGIHFGTVVPPNVGQRPTLGPESSLLWESATLTVDRSACRPTAVPKWIRLCADMGGVLQDSVRLVHQSDTSARRRVFWFSLIHDASIA